MLNQNSNVRVIVIIGIIIIAVLYFINRNNNPVPNTGVLPSNINEPQYSPYVSEQKQQISVNNQNNDFVYKKQKFTRRTPEDIKDQFDVDKMLPQEVEEGWFDTEPLATAKKIKGPHMIHPKEHMGINTISSSFRNATHDIRGDIPNPTNPVSPWGNSTIKPDYKLRGLCI